MALMAGVACLPALFSAESKSGLPNASPPVDKYALRTSDDVVSPMPREAARLAARPQGVMLTDYVAALLTQDVPKVMPKALPRGLKPTPKAIIQKLLLDKPFKPGKALVARASSVVYVPKKMSMWLNDTYGDCVTAEEAFNQATTGTFITDQTVFTFAKKYGWLNGAYLTEVMDQMQKQGFQQDGKDYGIGDYLAVDFADEENLKDAISGGTVKIGVDSASLPSGAGKKMGWYATGGRPGQFSNEDHNTSLCGYGDAKTIFTAINAPLPSGLAPDTQGYAYYTWDTIGFVDHKFIMASVQEAYIRNPVATVNHQPVPNPGPGPNPLPPVPPVPPVPPTPVPGDLGAVVVDPVTGTISFTGPWKIKVGDKIASPKMLDAMFGLVEASKF